MNYRSVRGLLPLALCASLLLGCGGSKNDAGQAGGQPPAEAKELNIYNWVEYIEPHIIDDFQKETGIKVRYDVFDSNELVQTKLLAGKTGYDLVVPSASFLARQIDAGVIQALDKSKLPNLANEDQDILAKLASYGKMNDYAVNYFWGTSGVGYNVGKIKAAMPNAPVDSFAMFYDPAVIRNFKKCGVSVLDAADEVYGTVLVYLGRDPNVESAENLKLVEDTLLKIRPYVRMIDSAKYIDDLANGEICLALGWNGDVGQASRRAAEANKGNEIKYNIPKEGAIMFFDMLAIPKDAAHPLNAHLFMDYLMRADVAAKNSSFVHYPTAVAKAYPLVDKAVYTDPGVYPAESSKSKLYINAVRSPQFMRQLDEVWTRFKTGQ